MAEKALTDSDASEGDVICAPKLLEIILQNCRGRVDACVPHFINLALSRLAHTLPCAEFAPRHLLKHLQRMLRLAKPKS